LLAANEHSLGGGSCSGNAVYIAFCVVLCYSGFPLYFGIEIQWLFKDFQGPWCCIGPILDGSLQHRQYYSDI